MVEEEKKEVFLWIKKTHFDLELPAVDASLKLKVIKEVRTILGLGLKEVILLKRQKIW